MNPKILRMKGGKKGVTPVIATIILIAGTLVLALVVGAYTFGLFGSNVKTVTLASATLYGGISGLTSKLDRNTTSLGVSLNNPGSATTITSLELTGTSLTTPLQAWNFTTGQSSQSSAAGYVFGTGTSPTAPDMLAGQVNSYTFYALAATYLAVTTGQTYNYVINFANGQSVSGSLIAQ
jgi:flagellin-like protein